METPPLCAECPADAIVRLNVGSLGIVADLCAVHLAPHKQKYELALTPYQITSLVRIPDRVEDQYKEVIQDLRESERATSETLSALDAANQKIARLELDCEKLARRVAEEKRKVLDRLESEERLTAELEAERVKVERLEPFEEMAAELEAQLTALENLTGIQRGFEREPSVRLRSEGESTGEGSPAAGEPWAVVEGSERPSTVPPTGR